MLLFASSTSSRRTPLFAVDIASGDNDERRQLPKLFLPDLDLRHIDQEILESLVESEAPQSAHHLFRRILLQ